MLPLLCVVLALASAATAAPPALTADFDGDGRTETATARPRGKAVRLEIADPKGKRLAAADAPAPQGSGSALTVRLKRGDLGSPGVLLEVVAAGSAEECHSIWRYKDGALARLPVKQSGRPLPDCAGPDGWTARWERPAQAAPSFWVRERLRETSRGAHREREVYAFTGFALELDSNSSSAQIAGVAIPPWNDAVLYTRPALENLKNCFDLSPFRAAPRLRIEASRAGGVFALHFTDLAGELTAPVVAAGPGGEKNQLRMSIKTDAGETEVRATVRGRIVTEVLVSGLSRRWDSLYIPASRLTGAALEIFARAEDEVASDMLTGLWTSERGENLALNLVPGVLGALEMRRAQVEVSLDRVPAGTDVLLVPRDSSAPAWAITLRGPNGIGRVPVKCDGHTGAWSCETAGPAEAFHRVGGRMNAR